MSETKEELIEMVQTVKPESEKYGLKLNVKKTKAMATGGMTNFEIDDERVEVVDEFLFLGLKISEDASCEGEVRQRIALGRKAMMGLAPIMKDRKTRTDLKVRLCMHWCSQ